MQKVTFVSAILLGAVIYSCEFSSEKKKELKKSLLLKEHSLQIELKQMNDTLIKFKNEIKIEGECLKKAKGFKFIDPAIKNDEIKICSFNIECLQKSILNLQKKIEGIKRELRQMEMEVEKLSEP